MSRIDVNSHSHFRNSPNKLWRYYTYYIIQTSAFAPLQKPVEKVDAEIQKIVDDMFETMYLEEGIGLAATQVDIHQRIIVIDISETRDQNWYSLIQNF